MEAKSFASLTSGLLARKGQAKPAMRPHGFGGFGLGHAPARDDLGWNDMGYDATPAPVEPEMMPAPPVVVQEQARLVRELAKPMPATMPVIDAASIGKAAFTLRLDGERHLRLRLASAVAKRSAQQIVTEALDQWLAKLPQVNELAARVRASDSAEDFVDA